MASTADASVDALSRDSQAVQFHSFSRFRSDPSDWVKFEPKKASGMAPTQVESLAEGLAKQLDYVPGSDIRELVGRIGGSLLSTALIAPVEDTHGALYVRPNSNQFMILLPVLGNSRQDQLSVAKALGHYFLHHRYLQIEADGKPCRAAPARAEHEALLFALAFLMPEAAFTRALETFEGKVELVAASFGVPLEAAELRGRRLNIPS
jgi:predicted transcriptional regulator